MKTALRHLLAGIALCALVPAWAQQSCGPPDGGPPSCDGGGPASQPDPDALAGAGNPINLINGNKYQREVDMPPLPGVLGLEIVRHYNSALASERSPNGLLGRGWRLSYETELTAVGPTVQILQADGRRLIFNRDPSNPSLCAGNDPAQGTIGIESGAQGPAYTWRWPNGRQLHFNSRGQLLDIRAASGEALSLLRAPDGKLLRITDPQGRQLRLEYLNRATAAKNDQFRGLQSIDSPLGHFEYRYEATAARSTLANLTEVLYPQGSIPSGRRYHYEDPQHRTLLTGISLVSTGGSDQRIARYDYNAQGEAIRTQWTTPHGEESVKLQQFDPPALDGTPGTTVLMSGDGRANTYTTGIRGNRYRLLETRGPGCARCPAPNRRYSYDALGRLQDQSLLDNEGHPLETLHKTRDARGRVLSVERIDYAGGKSQKPQSLLRYRYEGDPLTTLEITRPSVVPGGESVLHLGYNVQGQITEVRQSGWAPAVQGKPQPIERRTTYTYSEINGISRLTQIDGPLPNGPLQIPADSDITLYRYNAKGRLEEIISPMNRSLKLAYNEAGRERTRYAPTAVSSAPEPELASVDLDEDTSSLIPHAIPDPEGRKQVAWQDADNAVWLKAAYGLDGTAAAHARVAIQSVNGTAYRLLDDFGRVVAIQNPRQGWQQAHYDAAGRLMETVDPRGARQVIERDAAGRLKTLQRYPPDAKLPESVITQRYDETGLAREQISDADGVRSNTYTYDSQGRLATEVVRIEPAAELAKVVRRTITLQRAYRYDNSGRRLETELTDSAGHVTRLQQAYDSLGRVASIATQGALPRGMGGQSLIIQNIEWQQVRTPRGVIDYAAGLTHGNDQQEQWPLSTVKAGRPAQIQSGPNAAVLSDDQGNDEAGFPAHLAKSHAQLDLNWNVAGQLAETRLPDRHQRYLYDARGRRVLKLVSGGRQAATVFLYDGTRLIAEANADGVFTFGYAYLGYRPVAQLDLRQPGLIAAARVRLWGPHSNAIQTQASGKVVLMSDDKGKAIWRDTGTTTAVHQPLRYVGQYHDDETGLDYHGARYFDPARGRFISPDPEGIADALHSVPINGLLDLYAYAGNDPDHYFDPDGAARIRYYAITTGADGKPLGTDQGFTQARWAFVIDDITANPNDTSELGKLRNEYSALSKTLLVDVGGDFQGGTDVFVDSEATMHADAFKRHYGNELIELPNFTVEMDDDKATYLIAYYAKDPAAQGSCPIFNQILPQIIFADEEAPIDVTQAASRDAKEQRIVSCGKGSENDIVQRRIQKYNYAAMLLESFPSQINKNCSKDGCPGKALQGTSLDGYYASYGKTQIIGTTLYDYLLQMKNDATIDAKTRADLQLDDLALWADKTGAMAVAFKHALYIQGNFFDEHTATTPDWNKVDAKTQNEFISGSGLDKTNAEKYWNDMNAWRKNPGKNREGEASAALATQVMMEDAAVKNYMMGIYKDSVPNGKFDLVSLYLMRGSYDSISTAVNTTNAYPMNDAFGQKNPDWVLRQREIEIELAARTARIHNGSTKKLATGSLTDLMEWDKTKNGRLYSHRFLNIPDWPFTDPKGQPTADYFDFRCSSELPATVKGQGLKLTPLSLALP